MNRTRISNNPATEYSALICVCIDSDSMPTRRNVLLGVTGIVGMTGCMQIGGEPGPAESGGTSPDYRTVSINNERDQSVEIEITVNVTSETKTVHSEIYDLDPGEEKLVYNTSSDDFGARSLEVTAKTDSGNITRGNHGCDGHTPVIIEPDGSLSAYNAVC